MKMMAKLWARLNWSLVHVMSDKAQPRETSRSEVEQKNIVSLMIEPTNQALGCWSRDLQA